MSQSQLLAMKHDEMYRARFLKIYEPLVYKLAKKAGNDYGLFRAHSLGDLVSFGLCGLVQALDKFDPLRSVAFISYAYPRIKGAILDGVRSEAAVSRWYMERARRVYDEFIRQCNLVDRHTALVRTASVMNLSRQKTQAEIQIATEAWIEPTNPNAFESLSGTSPEPGLDFAVTEEVRRLLAQLPEYLRAIVHEHYFQGELKTDIARRRGKSPEWVRERLLKAEKIMRQAAQGRGLREYLNAA